VSGRVMTYSRFWSSKCPNFMVASFSEPGRKDGSSAGWSAETFLQGESYAVENEARL
jgi:hypothetical protein